MRGVIKGFTILVFIITATVWVLIGYYAAAMPQQFSVTEGKTLRLDGVVTAVRDNDSAAPRAASVNGTTHNETLRLFGVFPIKTVRVQVVEQPVVVVAGVPFGIKLYTDGVLIVGFTDVDTAAGPYNPARTAGLRVGDVVVSVDGRAVNTNEELKNAVESSGGSYMTFVIRRDNLSFSVRFRAVRSQTENCYKSGFWVRDSSAGIGTLTFFDPDERFFGGLGHAVCDVDTDEPLPISAGEIVAAEIYDVEKGSVGTAGSLCGAVGDDAIGNLVENGAVGVFGILTRMPGACFRTMPVAMKQQVSTGSAQMLTTVAGTTPQLYDIEIVQIRYSETALTKNMTIRVTDPVLLEKTGGIVQGMSGSPILKDGRLVGAVTHVLLDDPTMGYAIFAENMLERAQTASEKAAA